MSGKMNSRLGWCAKLLAGASTLFVAGGAQAAGYPERPVHIIVGFAAGGGTDFLARLIAQKLSTKWGQSVVVENRTGADGSIAEDYVVHSSPDGYTIAWITNTHTVTPSEFKLSYDPIASFSPITEVGYSTDVLLVNPTVPVHSTQELIDYAKAHPGALNFGAGGTADPSYLEAELFMKLTGINMVPVSYQGGSQILTAVLGGEIQVYFGSLSTVGPQIKAGTLRPLAVTSSTRSPIVPDLPTIAEAAGLPGYEASTWYGVLVPAKTPKDVATKLHDDFVEAIKAPDVQQAMSARGFATVAGTSDAFAKTIDADIARWAPFVKPAK